ncbi:adenosine receptor A2b-like [Patiria miniata]|uniref:G-protein coupled receptors family 1 profile domain-containing protein n=1 Tax=Patiria miniata TaxID=46514 RepID=A0A913Z0W7_PATMI|nr:adenosine receptor A2b-like [Patiria miniata]
MMDSRVWQTVGEFTNISSDRRVGLLCEPDEDIELFARPVDAVVIFVTAVCILAANALNFAVLATTPSLCNVHGYLLTALTAGGFCLGCLAASTVYPVWAGCWPYDETTCVVSAYFASALTIFNAFVINLLNVERYIAICHPLWYTAWVTKTRISGAVCVSLFVSFTPLIPLMITDKLKYVFIGSGYICIAKARDAENLTLSLVFACVVTIPSFVIVVMTGFAMLRRLSRRSHQLRRLFGSVGMGVQSGRSTMQRRNARLLVVSVLIIIIYVICWIPLTVINMIHKSRTSRLSGETPALLLSLWLAVFVSPMCNTVIYLFTMDVFKERIKSLLVAFFRKVCGIHCKSDSKRNTQNDFVLSETTLRSDYTSGYPKAL